jgi:transcriptional regulator with XRE-family HTH domain
MDATKTDRANRLKQLLKHLEITQKGFSNRTGIPSNYVSHLLIGHRNLTEKMSVKIVKAYPKLNREWLLWGEGEMIKGEGVTANAVYQAQESEAETVQEIETVYGPLQGLKTLLENLQQRVETLEEEVRELKAERNN